MPMYTFQTVDGETTKKKLTFKQYDAIKEGSLSLKHIDGTDLTLLFDPGSVGFVLKDGQSGGWASKALKENKYRAERSQTMAKREKDHVFKNKLVPNLNGEEAHSWKDIRDEVRSKSGAAAAKTYDRHVALEAK